MAVEQYLPVELLGEARIGVLLQGPRCAAKLGFVHYAAELKRLRIIEKRIRAHWRRPRAYQPQLAAGPHPSFGDLGD